MNLETFKKVLSLTPNHCFIHVAHPFGSGVLNAIKENTKNLLIVNSAFLVDEFDLMVIVNQNKGKNLTVVVTDVNRMLPSIQEAFMREFFFNFPTNFENSRLILLTNYEYNKDSVYVNHEFPFADICVCSKFSHYRIEK